ncbi:MAG: type II secretion system F family protein [Candidatus Omnitrophota bacterium]
MPLFRYLCFDQSGRRVKGELEAADPAECRLALKNRNLFPVKFQVADASKKIFSLGRKVSQEETTASLRQLASLIDSHIPIVEAVETVAPQIKDPVLARAFRSLSESLRRGTLFSEALRREGVFPSALPELAAASEASGTLGATLSEFARSEEAALRLRRRVINSLVYPIFLAGISLVVLLFLFLVVLPKVSAVFAESGVLLPAFTRFTLSFVLFLKRFGIPVLILLFFLYFWWRQRQGTQKGREYFWRIIGRLPIARELSRKHSLALFARNLSVLHRGGVRLIEAMHLVSMVIPDPSFRKELTAISHDLGRGISLNQALNSNPLFPPFIVQMARVGEETGKLAEMMEKAALHYEEDLETGLTRLVALLEPTMIVVMGVLVGGIVISVLLPIFEMSRIIK